jgi:hypothetical protein
LCESARAPKRVNAEVDCEWNLIAEVDCPESSDPAVAKLSRKRHKEEFAHLGAKCIVLDQDSNNPRNRWLIAEGKYTHSFGMSRQPLSQSRNANQTITS